MNNQKHFALPHLGMRIIKTAVAVFLCMVFHSFKLYSGSAAESSVCAIICIQACRDDTLKTSFDRVLGTLMGALWGLLYLVVCDALPHEGCWMYMIYAIMATGVVLTIYSSIILKQVDSAGLASIVFISIMADFPISINPFQHAFVRLGDVIVGIVVSLIVNNCHLPRQKHPEYLFFLRLQDLVPDRFDHMSSIVHVILNRLVDSGARICLTSHYAPAFLLSQVDTLNLGAPLIVMDGAAMYDPEAKRYINVISIPQITVARVISTLESMGISSMVYTVLNRSMMIYYSGQMTIQEKLEYDKMKRSPYRNYVEGTWSEEDKICFIRILVEKENAVAIKTYLQLHLADLNIRIRMQPVAGVDGYSGLFIFSKDASIKAQREFYLKPGDVPIEVQSERAYRNEGDALRLLQKVRSIYEPVHFGLKR